MTSGLLLPVTYNGQEFELPFRTIATGFISRFEVFVDSVTVVFEKDDAGEYWAVIYDADTLATKYSRAQIA